MKSLSLFYKEILCAFNSCKLPSAIEKSDKIPGSTKFSNYHTFKIGMNVKDLVNENGIQPNREITRKVNFQIVAEYATK